MNGRWTVRRLFSPGWLAFTWRDDDVEVKTFPTWREAFDYADRMARADQ